MPNNLRDCLPLAAPTIIAKCRSGGTQQRQAPAALYGFQSLPQGSSIHIEMGVRAWLPFWRFEEGPLPLLKAALGIRNEWEQRF